MRVDANNLTGRKVYDRAGRALGDVAGLEIDSMDWRVTGVRVEVDREAADDLGVDKPMMGRASVILSQERVAAIGDVVTLRDSIEELRSRMRNS